MTAEFDNSGFSAVDKFFGNEKGDETENKSISLLSSSSATKGPGVVNIGKRRRGGTGRSNDSDSSKLLSSNILSKQILNVGRKRSREENVDDDGGNDHGVDVDYEEIDGGRTNIVGKSSLKEEKSKSPKILIKGDLIGNHNKSTKKKLGKKERQRQKKEETTATTENSDQHEKIKNSNEDALKTSTNSDVGKTSSIKPSKRKRRKVRSRQKNIRKDNRSVDDKPAHLIPGNNDYQGRPITQATREKLNLPPSNKKLRLVNSNNNNKHQDSLFVIDRNPSSTGGDDVGVNLAIDEFMTSNTPDTTSTPNNEESNGDEKDLKKKQKSMKKKKHSSRFKNCR